LNFKCWRFIPRIAVRVFLSEFMNRLAQHQSPLWEKNFPGQKNYCRMYTHVRIIRPMGRPSLRDKILEAGREVMFRSGYHGAGVRDICTAAGAPHGSFTNHFGSKEEFAAEVLDQYFDYLKGLLRQAHAETLTPLRRIKRYLDIVIRKLERDGWKVGCLIGDLSLEASSHSNCLRKRLDAIFREWRALFASWIAAAQAEGEIESRLDATELAEFLLASWEGAILRMKVERNPAALERFKTIMFKTVFKAPATSHVSKRRRTRSNRLGAERNTNRERQRRFR
jgi:TetR/AcrR family transcriptional repressor of nem operon